MGETLDNYEKTDKRGVIALSVMGIISLLILAYFLGLTESQSGTLYSFDEQEQAFAFDLPDTVLPSAKP